MNVLPYLRGLWRQRCSSIDHYWMRVLWMFELILAWIDTKLLVWRREVNSCWHDFALWLESDEWKDVQGLMGFRFICHITINLVIKRINVKAISITWLSQIAITKIWFSIVTKYKTINYRIFIQVFEDY